MGDHPDLVEELRERRDPGRRGQRRIRRADTYTLPTMPTTTYSLHRQGASPAWVSTASTTAILQAGQAPSSSHTPITTPLPADPGHKHLNVRRKVKNTEVEVVAAPINLRQSPDEVLARVRQIALGALSPDPPLR